MMPEEADPKQKSKHRKSTCAGCRRRKSKCDGKVPKCTTCIAYKDECHYDKPPSLAYVRSLEEEVHELKQQLRSVKTQAWLSKTVSTDERKPAPVSPASESVSTSRASMDGGTSLPHRNPRQIKWETDISVDDEGSVTFHNSTSAVHQPASESRRHQAMPLAAAIAMAATGLEDEAAKRTLVQNATQQRQWEDFAVANTALKANVPREVSNELLKYHWCWIHPLFLMVYRPAFTRGMSMVDLNTPDAPDPPYFSDTLLKVIHAHCARFLNHAVHQHQYQTLPNQQAPIPITLSATQFMERMTEDARVSLGMETLKASSIPTIQALLQQSAREVVFGRSSQGWLYSGMAFRMAFDMGIHLPSDKLQSFVKSLSSEDIEIRKRLFWSCYTWDKIISLYLGRMPGFTPSTEDVPLSFMDDYSDKDLWAPYYGETPDPSTLAATNYPPCPGYVVSCFRHLCKLCVILNDLMQDIYSSEAAARRNVEDSEYQVGAESKTSNEAPFVKISRDLRDWWISLPNHLRIAPDQMPQLAPPVHIMSLNLTYHTTLILLNRPVILGTKDIVQQAAQRSYNVCKQATAAIYDLLMLQATTFGLSHVSYLNAYSAYIAATIAVLRFEREHKPGEDTAASTNATGLNFLLEVLQRSALGMPALERSVAIIRKRMKAVLDRQAQTQLSSLFPDPSNPAPLMNTTQAQMDPAQPTAFQHLSNPPLAYSQPTQSSGFVPTNNIPIPWQSNIRSSLFSEPVFTEDFLPAFPGQQFPVGSEHSFGSNDVDVDPQARAALMGFNLDPHPRLNAGEMDWNYVDAYMNEAQHM